MYIFTFNINQKDDKNTNILTKYPTVLINDSLRNITQQIRRIIKHNFVNLSKTHKIPIIDFQLGVSTIYKKDDFISLHKFDIDIMNIRETQEIIKNLNE